MTASLTQGQLGQILTLIDRELRRPKSREAGMAALAKRAERLNISLDRLVALARDYLPAGGPADQFVAALEDAPATEASAPALPEGVPVSEGDGASHQGDTQRHADGRQASAEGLVRSQPTPGTKLATIVEMLRQPGGASTQQIMAATGIKLHLVHSTILIQIERQLGLKVIKTLMRSFSSNGKDESIFIQYRIVH